jgi:hypothetical protein
VLSANTGVSSQLLPNVVQSDKSITYSLLNLGTRGGGWSMPHPSRFTSGKDLIHIEQDAEWASEPVWTGA